MHDSHPPTLSWKCTYFLKMCLFPKNDLLLEHNWSPHSIMRANTRWITAEFLGKWCANRRISQGIARNNFVFLPGSKGHINRSVRHLLITRSLSSLVVTCSSSSHSFNTMSRTVFIALALLVAVAVAAAAPKDSSATVDHGNAPAVKDDGSLAGPRPLLVSCGTCLTPFLPTIFHPKNRW